MWRKEVWGQWWLLEALWLGTPGLQLGLCRHKFLWAPFWLQIIRGVITDITQLWPVDSSRPSAIGWTRVNSMCAQGRDQGSRGQWGCCPYLPASDPSTNFRTGSPKAQGTTQYASSQQGNDGGRPVLSKVGTLLGTQR